MGKHLDYMRTQGIKVPSVMHKLPSFYWLPKLHKNLYGNRFIAASNAKASFWVTYSVFDLGFNALSGLL